MPHITFIHGISNKPPEKQLRKIWLDALASNRLGNNDAIDLGAAGVSTSMIYWADILYDNALEEGEFESVVQLEAAETVAAREPEPDMSWREGLSGEEKEMIDALAAKLSFDILVNDQFVPSPDDMARSLERIPLPWFVKRRLMKWLLKDVHHYLFNFEFSPRTGSTYKVQDEIRNRVLTKLREGAGKEGPHIVVSHSMGTVIIYDCLKRVADCPPIDGLMTIGSPLGMDEIQDKFKPEWTREDGFPEKLKGLWVNVYDMLDPVTNFDGNISNDYRRGGQEGIEIIHEANEGAWRHNITNYLSRPKLRAALHQLINQPL